MKEFPSVEMKDLIILAADKCIESSLQGMLPRYQALGIQSIGYEIFIHPHKDPGCFSGSDKFLQSFVKQYRYAIVVFDREGCGKIDSRADLEYQVEMKLAQVGWQDRSAAIVLDPELEAWVWTRSPHVDDALGWREQTPNLRSWLVEEHYLNPGEHKPQRPKEAMEAALRKVKKPRSASIYMQLAKVVSLQGHEEPAFMKLQNTLREWFPDSTVIP